ncbi:MAG: hypothetical protein HOI47_07310 [Candidatus Scalindua sp.]|nr:hypothetical protein [Candidatus Scalindua sp.]
MEKKNKEGSIKNIFRQLDDDCSLWLLGLCLASNDIVLFLKRRENLLFSHLIINPKIICKAHYY